MEFTSRPRTRYVYFYLNPLLAGSCLYLLGCAGPTTPLGAVWVIQPPQDIEAMSDAGEERATASIQSPYTSSIQFNPVRQVLHGAKPVSITISDPVGVQARPKVLIRYDGLDVTKTFLKQAKLSKDVTGTKLTLKLPVVRLSPDKAFHRITVSYLGSSGERVSTFYPPPSCSALKAKTVRRTEKFNPSKNLLRLIDHISRSKGYNPSFTTALIAQESAFLPQQISWAKAIGLTQVTPLAEEELLKVYSDFPRYPGLNQMPVAKIKTLMALGEVNEHNEWRLNPEYSIRGGISYVQLVTDKWSSPENERRIRAIFKDPEAAHTKLVLASYNSGYSRVLTALSRHGKNWMNSPELKEARNYVNRILSYCDYFSEESDIYETAT